jgi:aspartate kinase
MKPNEALTVRANHSLTVMKFGGAALATSDHINSAVERIIEKRKSNRVVVVVSARGDETDKLLELTRAFSDNRNCAEVDTVLAAGEQIAAGLMALALAKRGVAARSFLAHQLPLITDSSFGDGQILRVETEKLTACLSEGVIPVVAGFQGVDESGRLVTLGRGGSDTSAVSIAAALGAETCELYKDVDAVYSADPKKVPTAQKHRHLLYSEMKQIAAREPQIVHHKAVGLAEMGQVRLHVRSAFSSENGTVVGPLNTNQKYSGEVHYD